jgi:hypothetical protein
VPGRTVGFVVMRWRTSPVVPACIAAAAFALVAVGLGWRGADWPAQLYRIDLFRRAGFTQWDNQWYGGHHTPGYSLLLPPLGAVLGPGIVAVASAVLATFGFSVMADRWLPAPRASSVIFGAGTVVNVAVGRLTFALGLALGMSAAAAMATGRRKTALALAPLTTVASPVAGVFLMLAGTAWALAAQPVRRFGFAVGGGAAAALGLLVVAFPEGGRFPFSVEDCALTAAVGLLALALPARYRALRLGGLLYAVAALITVVVPNTLGANITRLGMFIAAPVVVGALWPARRRLATVLVGPLLFWQWMPAADGIFTAGLDPSSNSEYYDALLNELDSLPPARVEIPFTRRHWEATYVAPHAALARGWERQLDIGVNPLFYEPSLSPDTYMQWLNENAVGYVALPDADLDESALVEADLLHERRPELEPIWHDAHWQLFRVTTAKPMVEGPARLTEMDADSFTLSLDVPGDVLVRIHYSSHWDVDGPGCAVPSAEDWTVIRFSAPGTWRVRQVASRWIPFEPDRFTDCPVVE